MKKKYFIFVFVLTFITGLAQESDELWSKSTVSAKSSFKKVTKKVFPNKFNIYDLKGNLVQKKQAILSNNLWVDVSDLKKGVYVLSILNDEKVEFTGSFIKE